MSSRVITRLASRVAAGVLLAGLAVTPLACGSPGTTAALPSSTPAGAATKRAVPHASTTPHAQRPTPAATRATPACTPAPLERQAAATLVVGLPGTTSPDDPLAVSMPALGVGGIFLDAANVQSAGQVRSLIAAIKARRAAPLIVAADEEGGRVTTFSSIFGWQPSARDSAPLGAEALRTRAAALARQMKSLGVTLDFAPDFDVTAGAWDGPIGDRSYSGDPATVAKDALSVARGLAAGGITPVIKHFPGLGEADQDTHVTAPVVDAPPWVLLYRDMLPFIGAIKAGAPVVMVGHAEYPALGTNGLPASLSPAIYERLQRLGFRGVAFTDSLGMGAVNLRYDFPAAAVKALAAGADALLTTDGNQAVRMRDAIVTAVRAHLLPASRLADAAARVTALAGGDAYALTCRHVTLPKLR